MIFVGVNEAGARCQNDFDFEKKTALSDPSSQAL